AAACPLLVRGNGGNGGSVSDGQAHGGGGGGGQGVVIYSIPIPTSNITTQVNNGAAGADNSGGSTSAGAGSGSSGSGTIAASSGPLPIKLINFDALTQLNKVKLIWQTATEKNNRHFIIEKSQNAIDYTVLGCVKGAGNSSVIQRYELTDFNPIYGINYYRLKQIDFDGTSTFAPIVAIQLKEPGKFIVYPNPMNTAQNLVIELSQSQNQKVQIKIQDFAGKILYDDEFINTDTEVFSIINLNLEKGLYQISVRINDFSNNSQKLLVR
ncbi:MAG: T9SS type A sorting domain-containing protein, partial [Bacteroidota bacterium]